MLNHTAEEAVDYTLHQKHVAPRNIATIHESWISRFMSEDMHITREEAREIRATMIEAAEEARRGAGEAFEDEFWYMIRDLERVNENVDSVRVANLIERYRNRVTELREGTEGLT